MNRLIIMIKNVNLLIGDNVMVEGEVIECGKGCVYVQNILNIQNPKAFKKGLKNIQRLSGKRREYLEQLIDYFSFSNLKDAILMGAGEEICHFIALICDIGLHNQRQLCASNLWHKDLPKYVANLFWNYFLDIPFEIYKNTGDFSVPSLFYVNRNIA